RTRRIAVELSEPLPGVVGYRRGEQHEDAGVEVGDERGEIAQLRLRRLGLGRLEDDRHAGRDLADRLRDVRALAGPDLEAERLAEDLGVRLQPGREALAGKDVGRLDAAKPSELKPADRLAGGWAGCADDLLERAADPCLLTAHPRPPASPTIVHCRPLRASPQAAGCNES